MGDGWGDGAEDLGEGCPAVVWGVGAVVLGVEEECCGEVLATDSVDVSA